MSRYRKYDGGDPLAPPVDLAEALDAIGQDVMAGYSPERAMREFLRRGGQRPGRPRRARPPGRRAAARDPRSATTSTAPCARSRELLDKAVLAERGQLARDITMDDGDRAFREMHARQPAVLDRRPR